MLPARVYLGARAEPVAWGGQILSEDYGKVAFLCADRTVHLHAKYGAHYRTRIPRAGRDLAFAPESANLLIVGSSPDIYRWGRGYGIIIKPYGPLQSGGSAQPQSREVVRHAAPGGPAHPAQEALLQRWQNASRGPLL